jgi:Na+-translocating ferredoxin:NAD+ oxidoreductase RnfG subunit
MRSISNVRHPFKGDKIWKTADGSWLIVDEVLGKHEMITYAVGINSKGEILGIEIMEYVESYGYEIQGDDWRRQFIGKTASHPIKLNQDIQNISGATLSAKHVTDGVKRVMALYDIALKSE